MVWDWAPSIRLPSLRWSSGYFADVICENVGTNLVHLDLTSKDMDVSAFGKIVTRVAWNCRRLKKLEFFLPLEWKEFPPKLAELCLRVEELALSVQSELNPTFVRMLKLCNQQRPCVKKLTMSATWALKQRDTLIQMSGLMECLPTLEQATVPIGLEEVKSVTFPTNLMRLNLDDVVLRKNSWNDQLGCFLDCCRTLGTSSPQLGLNVLLRCTGLFSSRPIELCSALFLPYAKTQGSMAQVVAVIATENPSLIRADVFRDAIKGILIGHSTGLDQVNDLLDLVCSGNRPPFLPTMDCVFPIDLSTVLNASGFSLSSLQRFLTLASPFIVHILLSWETLQRIIKRQEFPLLETLLSSGISFARCNVGFREVFSALFFNSIKAITKIQLETALLILGKDDFWCGVVEMHLCKFLLKTNQHQPLLRVIDMVQDFLRNSKNLVPLFGDISSEDCVLALKMFVDNMDSREFLEFYLPIINWNRPWPSVVATTVWVSCRGHRGPTEVSEFLLCTTRNFVCSGDQNTPSFWSADYRLSHVLSDPSDVDRRIQNLLHVFSTYFEVMCTQLQLGCDSETASELSDLALFLASRVSLDPRQPVDILFGKFHRLLLVWMRAPSTSMPLERFVAKVVERRYKDRRRYIRSVEGILYTLIESDEQANSKQYFSMLKKCLAQLVDAGYVETLYAVLNQIGGTVKLPSSMDRPARRF
jgi:hypothetical protein